MAAKGHVYYMTQRPFDIGCQPNEGLMYAESYAFTDQKVIVPGTGKAAYAKLVYDRELTQDEIDAYELVRG